MLSVIPTMENTLTGQCIEMRTHAHLSIDAMILLNLAVIAMD